MKEKFWRVVHLIYPPFLRVLEKAKLHDHRQNFLIGRLDTQFSLSELKSYLISKSFITSPLSWSDPGEVLNLRLLVKQGLYQYHIRVYDDGEIRAHYEYSSEGNPLGHILETVFEPEYLYFQDLLDSFLYQEESQYYN